MYSSSFVPGAKALPARSRISLMRDNCGCITCRVRQKKCSGIMPGHTSCGECLRLNFQCLGISDGRPDWLRNPEALKETKYRIKRHLTEYPVMRGRAAAPGRPHLDFHDLIEKYSPSPNLHPWVPPAYAHSRSNINPGGMINQGFTYGQPGYYNLLSSPSPYYPYAPDEPLLSTSPISPYPQYTMGGYITYPAEIHSRTWLMEAYYTAYTCLLHGSGSQKALPPELVLYICRLAGYERWHTKAAPNHKGVYEWNSQIQSLMWFQTEPFTKQMLSRTKSVQLVTRLDSHSYMGDQSVGWFELQVARPTQATTLAKVKCRLNGDEISWCSHKNTDAGTAQHQGYFTERKGVVFDSGHELWSHIEEGDVLQVRVKAPLRICSHPASSGTLSMSTWWEPSPEMLELMDKRNRSFK